MLDYGWPGDNSEFHSFLRRLREEGGIKFDAQEADEKRTIKAEWLKKLVSGGVISQKIQLSHAIIDGELDLSYTTLKSRLCITESVFKGPLNLSFAECECGISLAACHFREKVEFRALHCRGDFQISMARFENEADCEDLEIDEMFVAEGSDFGQVSFKRSIFAKGALFCCALVDDDQLVQTRFRGEADFSDVNFNGPAFFKGASFHEKAIFDRCRIESSAFFDCDRPQDPFVKHRKYQFNTLPVSRERKPMFVPEFKKKVSFIGAHVGSSITFAGARFGGLADFRRITIEGSALFDPFVVDELDIFETVSFDERCLFWNANVKGSANFNGARFTKAASFEHIRIGGRAYFTAVNHKGDFHCVSFGGEADFHDAYIDGSVEFKGAHFKGDVSFQHAHIEGSMHFSEKERKHLTDKETEENFPLAFFDKTVHFGDSNIEGSIECEGAQFRGDVIFERTRIGGIAAFGPAKRKDFLIPVFFGRRAFFLDAYIRGSFDIEGAFFMGPVSFERLKTDGTAFFRAAEHPSYANADPKEKEQNDRLLPVIFCETATFISAQILGNAEFDGVQFLRKASFEQVTIGGDAYFRPWEPGSSPVHFHDDVKFIMAHIKGNAEFSGAVFDGEADFTGMRVDGHAYFDARHHYDDLEREIAPLEFKGAVKFIGSNFHNQSDFGGARFRCKVDFTGAGSVGRTSFKKSEFASQSSFEDAHFSSLLFEHPDIPRSGWIKSAIEWMQNLAGGSTNGRSPRPMQPQFTNWVNLRGCTYDRIDVKLEHLVEKMEPGPDERDALYHYDRQPYTHLIKTLRAGGDDRRADFIYLRQRKLERLQTWERAKADFKRKLIWRGILNTGNYLIDVLFWLISNYGVQPERLLYISLFFILLGTRIFCLPNAVVIKGSERKPPSSATATLNKENPSAWDLKLNEEKEQLNLEWPDALKMSVSQFIPVVDIPSGSKWRPNEEGTFRFLGLTFGADTYGSLHRLAGAILVPLLIAALAAALYRRLSKDL